MTDRITVARAAFAKAFAAGNMIADGVVAVVDALQAHDNAAADSYRYRSVSDAAFAKVFAQTMDDVAAAAAYRAVPPQTPPADPPWRQDAAEAARRRMGEFPGSSCLA